MHELKRLKHNIDTFLIEFDKIIKENYDKEKYVELLSLVSDFEPLTNESLDGLNYVNGLIERQIKGYTEYNTMSQDYRERYCREEVYETAAELIDTVLGELYNMLIK